MECAEMGICLPAEHHLKKMTRVMGEPVNAWIVALKPARQQIDREREAVHFRKQSDEKGAECAEGSPVAAGARLEERISKQDENHRINDDQAPQAITRFFVHLFSLEDELLPSPEWSPWP